MILFLVNTSTQLLNAAILARTEFRDKKCDVYYTDNVKEEAEGLCREGVFSAVYEISLVKDALERDTEFKKALVRIKNALDIRKIKKTLPSDPKQYTRVFASGVSLRNYEIYYAIKSLNSVVKFSLYEEGMCEYYYMAKRDWKKELFSRIFFGRYYLNDCDSLYVHSPEAVEIGWDNIRPVQIPPLSKTGDLVEKLNRSYGYKEPLMQEYSSHVVFLEQQFYTDKANEKQLARIRKIAEVVGTDRVLIKLHPRSPMDKYGGEFVCMDTRMPFEIIAMNEDVSGMTFVSEGSSSVLNFGMMLHVYPNVFMLSRMGRAKNAPMHTVDRLFQRVQKQFPGNFWIPETEEEFFQQLSQLNN